MSSRAKPGARDPWGRGLLRSPLPLLALLFTLGIVLDRLLAPPTPVGLAFAVGGLVAGLTAYLGGARGLGLVYLAGLAVGLGMVYHQASVRLPAEASLASVLGDRPVPVSVVGRLEEEPQFMPAERDPFRSQQQEDSTWAVLAIERLRQGGDWQSARGRVRLYLPGRVPDLHLGDAVEATGLLVPPGSPANPGEADPAAHLADYGIVGHFYVAALPGAWQRRVSGWHESFAGWLAVLRGSGQATLATYLPPATAPLAMALLLGDGAPVERSAWERYVRTGIVAVLAVSGQHLVILAAFLEAGCRLAGWRQRRCVGAITLFLLGYALLTGGRPPALRAAVVAVAFALAILLRRPVGTANALALAWLTVAGLDPADLFSAGCQFSFLAAAVLLAFPVLGPREPNDPLDRLLEESDPAWWVMLRAGLRLLARFYLASLVLWLVLTPLAAWHYHLIAPAGCVLGPPLALLASLALFLGFALFLLAPLPWLAVVPAGLLDGVLRLMQWLIDTADAVPGAWKYLPDLPTAGVLLFYAVLLAALASPWQRWRWRVLFVAGPAWLALVLLVPFRWPPGDEIRATFLAVGHGTCVVVEFPDGRVALYDAGSLRGPGVAAKQIAPYLWSRGIGRLDEVFLSHADLDHFNGLPALLIRFPIGRVSTTPTFAARPTEAVRVALDRLRQNGVAVRRLHAGQVLTAGATTLEVLHPPPEGLPGTENARSLVLRIEYAGRSLLLTGDLEGAGLDRLLAQPPRPCEVVQFPHHASKRLDPTRLVRWAGPTWLVACQGATTGRAGPPRVPGVRVLSTHTSGAITFRGTAAGWSVETFRGE